MEPDSADENSLRHFQLKSGNPQLRRESTPFLIVLHVAGCNTELQHAFPGKPVFETPFCLYLSLPKHTWPLKIEREQDRAVLGELNKPRENEYGNNLTEVLPKMAPEHKKTQLKWRGKVRTEI